MSLLLSFVLLAAPPATQFLGERQAVAPAMGNARVAHAVDVDGDGHVDVVACSGNDGLPVCAGVQTSTATVEVLFR